MKQEANASELKASEAPPIGYCFFKGKWRTIVSRQRGSTNFCNEPATFLRCVIRDVAVLTWNAKDRARERISESRVLESRSSRWFGWQAESRLDPGLHSAWVEIRRDFAKKKKKKKNQSRPREPDFRANSLRASACHFISAISNVATSRWSSGRRDSSLVRIDCGIYVEDDKKKYCTGYRNYSRILHNI